MHEARLSAEAASPTPANRQKNGLPRPILKWAGGKGQLLSQFVPLFPARFGAYHEPFLGGGAVFFHLAGSGRLRGKAVTLTDNNPELINVYQMVRDQVRELIADLQRHQNEPGYYYAVRSQDPAALSPVQRASRMIFLNKTCYNGLWRVNRQGRFNVPFGRYKNPRICDQQGLLAAHQALQGVQLAVAPFAAVLERAQPGDFVYFDPPYHPLSPTSSFTSYTATDFGAGEQQQLAAVFRELDRKGCLVMLSNSDVPFIRELYAGFRVVTVQANRAINSKSDRRGPVTEVVVLNY